MWALMLRRPMTRWSVGRVTLLGDACHATLRDQGLEYFFANPGTDFPAIVG